MKEIRLMFRLTFAVILTVALIIFFPIVLCMKLFKDPDLLGLDAVIISLGGVPKQAPNTFKQYLKDVLDFYCFPIQDAWYIYQRESNEL